MFAKFLAKFNKIVNFIVAITNVLQRVQSVLNQHAATMERSPAVSVA